MLSETWNAVVNFLSNKLLFLTSVLVMWEVLACFTSVASYPTCFHLNSILLTPPHILFLTQQLSSLMTSAAISDSLILQGTIRASVWLIHVPLNIRSTHNDINYAISLRGLHTKVTWNRFLCFLKKMQAVFSSLKLTIKTLSCFM